MQVVSWQTETHRTESFFTTETELLPPLPPQSQATLATYGGFVLTTQRCFAETVEIAMVGLANPPTPAVS